MNFTIWPVTEFILQLFWTLIENQIHERDLRSGWTATARFEGKVHGVVVQMRKNSFVVFDLFAVWMPAIRAPHDVPWTAVYFVFGCIGIEFASGYVFLRILQHQTLLTSTNRTFLLSHPAIRTEKPKHLLFWDSLLPESKLANSASKRQRRNIVG